MILRTAIRPKGLFGGLTNEFKIDESRLIERLSQEWACGPIAVLVDVEDWRRGGAETYVAKSQVELVDGTVFEIVGKAFVGMGLRPTEQQERWEKRRRSVASAGVPVPLVYAQYPGMLIEEFIPGELPPASQIDRATAFQIGQIAHVLSQKGFHPVALLGDLRIKFGVVTMIDFGSDLGGEGQKIAGWESQVVELLSRESKAEFAAGFRTGFTQN